MSEGKNLRSIGKHNMNSLMKILVIEKSSSRREIAQMLGITKMTVSNIVTQLKTDGYLIEETNTESATGIGPKPTAIMINPGSILAVGVHISYTVVSVQLVDVVGGTLYQKEMKVDNLEADQRIVHVIKHLIEELFEKKEEYRNSILGIGVTYKGIVNSEEGKIVFNSGQLGKEEVGIVSFLRKWFDLPVAVAGEGEGAALAEIVFGHRIGRKKSYYLNMGEEIRGFYIDDYSLIHSAYGMSGEVGHMSIKYDGPLCLCGSRGCYHLYASLPVLLEKGHCHSLDELMLKLQERDPLSLRIMEEFIQMTVVLFVNIVNIYDPNMIFVGGELARLDPVIFKKIERMLNERVLFRKDRYIKIEYSRIKEDVNKLGAALVVLEQIGRSL